MTSKDQLVPTINTQPLSHRVETAAAEGMTSERLLASAAIWEARALSDDPLYSLDPDACRRFAREDRETAAALQAHKSRLPKEPS
jgi:hypothetical protein